MELGSTRPSLSLLPPFAKDFVVRWEHVKTNENWGSFPIMKCLQDRMQSSCKKAVKGRCTRSLLFERTVLWHCYKFFTTCGLCEWYDWALSPRKLVAFLHSSSSLRKYKQISNPLMAVSKTPRGLTKFLHGYKK